jgi:DNA-binding NarL/FixJ family response regulator
MKVLVADDHPLFRDALRHVAGQAVEEAECVEAHDLDQAVGSLDEENPFDLILLDLNMPGMDGLTGLLRLRDASPETPIIIVSATEDKDVVERALTCGAVGFIPKSTPKDEMIAAIATVLAGGIYRPHEAAGPAKKNYGPSDAELMEGLGSLTRRQRAVLTLLARGRSNKQIAFELDVTNTTVKAHVTAILRKLKVTSRTQAVIVARQIDGVR